MRFPLVFIDRFLEADHATDADGLTVDELHTLLGNLHAAGAHTPGIAGLFAGLTLAFSQETPYLPVFGESNPEQLAAWMRISAHHGATSLWCVPTSPDSVDCDVDNDDMPLLLGHGVVPVLRGPGDEPLTSLSVSNLRRRLDESRSAYESHLGHPPRWIMPPAPIVGRPTDDLVRRELREAGFTVILEPAKATGPDCADISTCRPDEPIIFRTVGPSDDIQQIRDWVLGDWRARSKSRVRQIADAPGRFARRLFDNLT